MFLYMLIAIYKKYFQPPPVYHFLPPLRYTPNPLNICLFLQKTKIA